MARALDGESQVTLMARAGAGLAARANFAAVADEAAQLLGRFVIDLLRLLDAELAHLGARRKLAARPAPFRARSAPIRARATLARLRRSGRSRRRLRLFLIRHNLYPS